MLLVKIKRTSVNWSFWQGGVRRYKESQLCNQAAHMRLAKGLTDLIPTTSQKGGTIK
ncbi:hypothetical protein [Escherichia phage AV127]|nr:hypothetical protein [Escherichia phage AV127]